MDKLHKYLFSFILALLILPGAQTLFRFVQEKPLEGVHVEQEFPTFTFQDWFGLNYQPKLNEFFVQHFGFRPFLTRLYNQFDYMVFKKANGHGVIVGKKDYLYERWFIDEYFGRVDYDERKISKNVEQLSTLVENLKKYNTKLLVVIAPGKSYIYPEYIPNWLKGEKKVSNYGSYSKALQDSNIPFIDLNKLFMEMKDTVPYPLFPKTGTHWSLYGTGLIVDSVVKKVEQIQNIKMNHLHISGYKLVSPNDDLEKIMNLLAKIPNDSIAYPIMRVEEVENPHKPNIIVIGDSFYWWLGEMKFASVFNEFQFWYYYKTVFNSLNTNSEKVKEIDFFSRITHADIVILLQSTASLHDLGWGSISDMYDSFENNPASVKELEIRHIVEEIKSNPKWLKKVNEKADERAIPLDSMIYIDAKYIFERR